MKAAFAAVLLLLLAGCTATPYTDKPENDVQRAGGSPAAVVGSQTSGSSPPSKPGPGASPPPGSQQVNRTADDGSVALPRPWNLSLDGWAPYAAAKVLPGVQVQSFSGGCTSNFVFTNPNGTRVFVGTAGHCAAAPAQDSTGTAQQDSCGALPKPSADPLQRMAFFGPNMTWNPQPGDAGQSDAVGRYLYVSTLAMAGETSAEICRYNDLAIAELDPDYVALANPSLQAWGGPVGGPVPAANPAMLAKAYTVGGTLYRSRTVAERTLGVPQVREETRPREGWFRAFDSSQFGGYHTTAEFDAGCLPGDSGSPVLDAKGQPLGVLVEGLGATSCRISYLEPMLAYAESHRGCDWCLPDDVHIVFQPGVVPFSQGVLPG